VIKYSYLKYFRMLITTTY